MNAPNEIREFPDRWEITNPKDEKLTITMLDVLSDTSHDLGEDPGLSKDGVEAHLQELLAADPTAIEDGLTLISREYPTAIGPVDLLCRANVGTTVAIEVKRRGEIDGVEQLGRYLEYLRADTSLGTLRGVFVAQSIKPQARTLAETRGLAWKEVDYDELRGRRKDELRLF
jgi:RecB family endonuclease NucS